MLKNFDGGPTRARGKGHHDLSFTRIRAIFFPDSVERVGSSSRLPNEYSHVLVDLLATRNNVNNDNLTTANTSNTHTNYTCIKLQSQQDLQAVLIFPKYEPAMQVEAQPQPKEQRPLHVEVAVHALCPTSLVTLQTQWSDFLEQSQEPLTLMSDCRQIDLRCLPAPLAESCLKATLCQDDGEDGLTVISREISPRAHNFRAHVFHLSEEEVCTEEIEPDGGDDEWTAGCDSLTLPHVSLDGLWETLILEPRLKQRLLDYAQSALLFSDRAVSSHLVHWNRILLLHGVPGTGKTSLCRSLAHKLAIRMRHRFPQGATLLDVRAHSLFSKWFSTSGKLVSTLFQMVRDMVQDDPNTLVCVLVDEVESLASSRNNQGASGDPSDAMRAVNSLLTSLDRLRSFPNVLVLATTNLTGSVDAAFVDRVDLKIHIGLPILKARYEILKSCIEELQRVGIIVASVEESSSSSSSSSLTTIASFEQQQQWNGNSNAVTKLLLECARRAEGLSGRSLRRLPLQAHAQFLGGMERAVSVEDFVQALGDAIQLEQISRTQV